MEQTATYKNVLAQTALFAGIEAGHYDALLTCLGAHFTYYKKGETIFAMGEPARYLGVLLSGSGQVAHEDIAGNRHILSALEPGDVFGESYAAAGVQSTPIAVNASAESSALLLRYERIMSGCPNACRFHSTLIKNLMGILAQKNIQLSQKLGHLSKRTLREKLLSYLMEQAQRQGGRYFTVPFNRQELADYLNVDRSALSAELSKMRAEGLVEFYKNEFKLMYGSTDAP